jgi:membrane protein DedA with SNARE-associated domain
MRLSEQDTLGIVVGATVIVAIICGYFIGYIHGRLVERRKHQ